MMLSLKLDPDLDRVLERYVDDLARYNILRFLHDNPTVCGDVNLFADRLGLRSLERVEEALEGLLRGHFLRVADGPPGSSRCYVLNREEDMLELVNRLYALSSSEAYGEIVERLAARSLHRARRSQPAIREYHG